MMLASQMKPEIQKLLGAEATKCASLRTNLAINTARNKPPDKMWYGGAHWENQRKQVVSKMHPFRRIKYVKTKKNCGEICGENHKMRPVKLSGRQPP
jgi:hypothetical protein